MFLGVGVPLTAVAKAVSGGVPAASLLLNFVDIGTLDPRITFTRADATSCATYFDSTGRMQTAAANVARFDYDPATIAGTTGVNIAPTLQTSSWGTASGWSFDGTGNMVVSGAGAFTNIGSMTNPLTLGKRYLISFTVSGFSGVSIFVGPSGQQGITNVPATGNGTFSGYIPALSVALSWQVGNASTSCVISNFSIQEVVFTPRGLLIEESRTNLLLQSRDMTNAAWNNTDTAAARSQVGIDGTANSACLLTQGVAGTAQTFQNPATTFTAGAALAGSFTLKYGNNPWVLLILSDSTAAATLNVWFNIQTGAVGSSSVGGVATGVSGSVINCGGGWYRCVVSGLLNGGFTAGRLTLVGVSANGGATRVNNSTYIVDCAQLEVGATVSSIIPTTTAAVTRAADNASMTGTNFSSWFSQPQGTLVSVFDCTYAIAEGANHHYSATIAQDGSQVLAHRIRSNLGDFIGMYRAGAYSGDQAVSNGAYTSGTVTKATLAYSSVSLGVAKDGGPVAVGASPTLIPAPIVLYIGNNNTASYLNGHIRSITYYNTRLPDATLQALTA
jgi:hypothetical protein